jgi:pimeloyl-ACP methyl ester carboxylesterase
MRLNIAPVITASITLGFIAAAVLVVGPFGGEAEHVITGTALLALAAGWALLAGVSIRWTDQPQRWAMVPATYLGLVGAGLLVFKPGHITLNALGWVWPFVVLALVIWMTVQVRRHLHSGVRRWIIYPLFLLYAATAFGGGYETIRESRDRRISTQSGSLVEVDGHKLYLWCMGSGGPTVILESGLGETSAYWNRIANEVSRSSRVCAYDRAGRGGSEPSREPLDGIGTARELHTLLAHANVPGPFVLVGHSSGAQYVRIFAGLYPEDVAGMVLLDGQPAEAFSRLPTFPSFYRSFRRIFALLPSIARLGAGRPGDARSLRDEFAELPIALDQAHSAPKLGDKFLIVVTAARDSMPGWLPLQDELAGLSKNSLHRVLPNATHTSIIDGEDSANSSQAIRDVIEAVRETKVRGSLPKHQR